MARNVSLARGGDAKRSMRRNLAILAAVLASSLIRPALGLTGTANWYWDTAVGLGAGGTPNGTWIAGGSTWNSDSTGTLATSVYTTLSTDDLYFVAGPSGSSGSLAYTATVSGTQTADGLLFQASGATTLSGGTINLGADGISIPQYAYGTTGNGIVTINSALVLQASQTWTNNSSVAMFDSGTLNLNGSTLTVDGSGNTFIKGAISGTTANPSFIKNGAGVLVFGTSFANTNVSSITLNNGSFFFNNNIQVPSSLTFNGGGLRVNGQTINNYQMSQTWTVNSGGGTLDIYDGTLQFSFTNSSTYTGTITGGSSSTPVTLFKTGTGIFQIGDNARITNSLNAKVGVYGGTFQFTSGTSTVQTNAKLYSADIVGGILKYTQNGTQNNLDSGFTASVGSSGGSIGGLYWYTTAALPTITGGNGGMLVLTGNTPSPFPNMASIGGGMMWLAGDRVLTSLAANSDNVYRLLGSDIQTANVLNGGNAVMIGAGANMLNGNPTHNPTVSSPQNFTGSLTIAGRFSNNSGINTGNSVLNLTQNSGAPATILGTTSVNIGPDATLNINNSNNNPTTAYFNSSAVVSINTGRLTIQGSSGTTGIKESFATLGVSGASSLSLATNNTTANFNQLTVANLNIPVGAYLTIQTPNATNNSLGGTNTYSPKIFTTNFNGSAVGTGFSPTFFSPAIRVNTGGNEFDGGSTWTKYSATTGLTAFVAADYTTNPIPASNGSTDAANADYTSSLTMTASGNLQSIRFTSGNPTLDPGVGHTLTVLGGGIMSNTVNGQIGNGTIANAGSLTTTAPALYINGGNQITINSKITGTFALVYNGNGTVSINNTSNDFVGNVYINSNNSTNVPGDGIFGNASNQIFFNGAAVTGITGTSWITGRTLNIGAGGVLFNLNDPTKQFIFNGKVTGSGPINIGTVGQATEVTFGSSSNDFTGLVYMAGQIPSNNNGNNNGSSIRTSAANVLGNNAAYITSENTAIDMTNVGGNSAGYSQSVGSLEGSGNVILGSSAVLTVGGSNASGVYSGNMSGGGGLTKTGTGTLSLTANQFYTGATTVAAGTLRLLTTGGAYNSNTMHGNIASSSSVIVGDTAAHSSAILDASGFNTLGTVFTVGSGTAQTVSGFGTIKGNTVIGALGALTPGDASTVGTLSVTGNLTLSVGTALNFSFGSTALSTSDFLAVTGSLTLLGNSNPAQETLNFSQVAGSTLSSGTYTIATSASAITMANPNYFTVAGVPSAFFGSVGLSGDSKSLLLTLASAGTPVTWFGQTDNTWSGHNWKATSDLTTTTDFAPLADVTFDENGAPAANTVGIVIPSAGVNPASVTFNNSATPYSFTSSGSVGITGNGGVLIKGGGTVTFNNANTYIGGTTVKGNSTLVAGSTGAFGAAGATITLGDATTGATLDLATDTTVNAYAVTLTGNATIKSNVATAGIGGITQILGALNIGSQTLTIAAGGNVNTSLGTAVVQFGAVSLSGAPTFSMGSGAQLTLPAISNGTNTITLTGAGKFAQTGPIGSGNGGLTLGTGFSGTATLSQANTYAGATNLLGGKMVLGLSNALPTATIVTFGSGGSNGTLDLAGNSQQVGGLVVGGAAAASQIITNSGATATLTVAGSSYFGGSIQNAVALTASSGTLTLTGTSNYTGATSINSGATLLVNGGTLGATAVSVKAGGTLSGNGTIGGSVTISSDAVGGILAPHVTPTGTAVLNANAALTTFTLNSGSILNFNFGAADGLHNDMVLANGLTLNGVSTLNVNALGAFTTGTYELFGFSGSRSGGAANLALGTAPPQYKYTFKDPGSGAPAGQITLSVDLKPTLTWTNGSTNGIWSTAADLNWNDGTSSAAYSDISPVLFTDSPAGTVSLVGTLKPLSVTASNTSNTVTLSGSGSIADYASGAAFLVKSNAGKLVMNSTTPNTYTGGTTINGGIIAVATATALGATSGGLTINDTGTLEVTDNVTSTRNISLGTGNPAIMVDSGKAYANNAVISGTGSLNATGSGTLVLGGNNNFSGQTIIQSGKVSVGSFAAAGTAQPLGMNANPVVIGSASTPYSSSNATLAYTGAAGSYSLPVTVGTGGGAIATTNTLTLTGVVSGNGTLTIKSPGKVILQGANNYAGGTIVDASTLVVGNGPTAGSVGSGRLTLSNGGSAEFAGVLPNLATLYHSTSGLANPTGATGGATPNTLNLGLWTADSAELITSSDPTTTQTITLNGVSGRYVAIYSKVRSSSSYGLHIQPSGVTIADTSAANVALPTAGTAYAASSSWGGSPEQIGPAGGGAWQAGANGGISGGTDVGPGPNWGIAQPDWVVFDLGASYKLGSMTIVWNQTNAASLDLQILTAGALPTAYAVSSLSSSDATTKLVLDSLQTVNVGDSSSTSFAGVISGGGALAKVGIGTLTLSNANTYAGGTTISSGTLAITNSTGSATGSGPVTVGNSGTLAGTGTIAATSSAITVAGAIAPSYADATNHGTLNVATSAVSGVTFNNGANLNFNFGSSAPAGAGISDMLNITGSLTLGLVGTNAATVTFNQIGGSTYTLGDSYTLVNASGGISGFSAASWTIAGIPAGLGGALSESGNSLILTLVNQPLTWFGQNSNTWNTSTTNWKYSSDLTTASLFAPPGAVTFDDNSSVNNVVVAAGGVAPSGVNFSNMNATYTVTGLDATGITGNAYVAVSGGGTVNLNSPNTYTGGTVVSNGSTLNLGDPGAAGAAGAAVGLSGGATLGLKTNASVNAYNVAIVGSGTVVSDVASPGPGITHHLGTLAIGSTLNVQGGANVTSGTAGVSFGATTLNNAATFNITNPATAGTTLLTLGAVNNGANTMTVTGNGNFAQSAPIGGGSGGFALAAGFTGTATLNQANLYTGGTTLGGGVLNINADGALGASNTPVTFAGGTLRAGAASIAIGTGRSVSITSTGTIDTNGNAMTINKITGAASTSLTKAGSGILNLTAPSTYAGATVITGGTIKLGGAAPSIIASGAVVNVDASVLTGTSTTSIANLGTGGGSFTSTGGAAISPTGVNGHKALVFNGTVASAFISTSAYANTGTAITIFVAEQAVPVGAYNGELGFISYPSGTNADYQTTQYLAVDDGGAGAEVHITRAYGNGGGTQVAMNRPISGGAVANAPLIWDTTYNGTNAFGDIIDSNGNLTTTSPTATTGNFSISTMSLGSRLGASTTTTPNLLNAFTGNIGQVLVFNTALSASDRAAVEAYLAAKWNAILPTTTPVQIASGATLDLNGYGQQVDSLSDSGIGGGVVTNGAAATSVTLSLATTGSTTFSGSIQDGAGQVGLSVSGTGAQVLAGPSNYTGATSVASGTLTLSSANAISASPISYSGGTLNETTANAISGTASVAVSGAGSLTLDFANNYTGATSVTSGALALAAPGAISGSAISVTGGTFSQSAANAISGTSSLTIGGAVSLTQNLANNYSGGTTVNGTAHLTIANASAIGTGGLTVNGGSVLIQAGLSTPAAPLVFAHLTPAGGVTDVTNNSLLIKSIADISGTIRDAVISGKLTTTTTITPVTLVPAGLGYLTGTEYTTLSGSPTFGGNLVGANDIVARWTYAGDINLDGVVDLHDFLLMDAGLVGGFDGTTGHVASWFNGDVIGQSVGSGPDGIVDFNDLAAADATIGQTPLGQQLFSMYASQYGSAFVNAYNADLAYGASQVPEPASLLLLGLGAAGLLLRRRK